MSRAVAVPVREVAGGRRVCAEDGRPIRWITRKTGEREPVHCEHPLAYREYGGGYIPDFCERCGWWPE